MADVQGIAFFPGINQIMNATFTLTHGITPSVCMMTIAPQDDFIGAGGTLVFKFGKRKLEFRDCRIDYNSLERNDAGLIWRLAILDRRWKWAFGTISGFYNLRNDDGTIRKDNQKSPQALADLLLREMGEPSNNFDLLDLPRDARPLIQWDGERPAEALAQLCEEFNCRLVYRSDDSIVIAKLGEGAELPDDSVLEDSLTIDPPEKPDSIGILCGHTRYQVDFLLEAVGIDSNGTEKPIDKLSYKPKAGWGGADVPWFSCVTQESDRKLAQATVFRRYRIKMPVEIPDYGTVKNLIQLLPIENEQVEQITDPLTQLKASKPAAVYGLFCAEREDFKNAANEIASLTDGSPLQYSRGFSIDAKHGVVNFAEPVYQITNNAYAEPVLRLRVAVGVRDEKTLAWDRFTKIRSFGSRFKTKTKWIRQDEITATVIPTYDKSFKVTSTLTNLDTGADSVNKQCDYYLDAAVKEFDLKLPHSKKYIGLRDDIEMDGAIHQITWSVGPDGATTVAARNTELLHHTLSFKERRALERTNQIAENKAREKEAVVARKVRLLR